MNLPSKFDAFLEILSSPNVTDILINGMHSFFIEENGLLVEKEISYTETDLYFLIEKMLQPTGRQIDGSKPFVEGKLFEGSRFHIILPPLAQLGPFISIRKQKDISHFSFGDFGLQELAPWLQKQVHGKKNLLIAGSTGSGKTTLLRLLIEQIGTTERLIALEECMEIQTQHPHLLSLEARNKNSDGFGEVTLSELFRNALRMRPDRIFVGECRGKEALDMLQAMNCGQVGSMTTIHANSALDSLRRLENLVCMSGFAIPLSVIREWIATSFHTVIFLEKKGATRQIREIISLEGMEGDRYRFKPIL